MTEIRQLVTAEAVKAALRTEDVLGALKQKIRETFESQIDKEVDAVLDTLVGPAEADPEPAPTPEPAPATGSEPEAGQGDGTVQADPGVQGATPVPEGVHQEPATML